jgi:AcrR family transcriptional regulator
MSRLTRDRWVEEGLIALQEDGPASLAADRMARRLGVSRGSFYWHFASAVDFEAAVLAGWEERWTNRIIAAVQEVAGTPRDRLAALIEKTGGQDASLYASAKRMARDHSELRGVMDRIDQRRIAFVAGMLAEGGIPPGLAARRARIVYSWAMGQMLVSGDEAVPAETASALVEFGFEGHQASRDRGED